VRPEGAGKFISQARSASFHEGVVAEFPNGRFVGRFCFIGNDIRLRRTISMLRMDDLSHRRGAAVFTFHFSPFTRARSASFHGVVAEFPNGRFVGRFCFIGNDIRLRRTISMLRMDDLSHRRGAAVFTFHLSRERGARVFTRGWWLNFPMVALWAGFAS